MKESKNVGCIWCVLVGISFWTWFVIAFIDIRTYIGAAIAATFIIISFLIKRKYKSQRIHGSYISIVGLTIAILVNLLLSVSFRCSIFGSTMMLLGFIGVFLMDF